jgi:formylglycine-generating enzyme required for sulfatase activity
MRLDAARPTASAVLLLGVLGLAACGRTEPAAPTTTDPPAWAKVAPEQIAEAEQLGVPVAFENDLGMRFVLIPAGTFLAGPPRLAYEARVAAAFYMQVTEVTNAQYWRLVPDHVCAPEHGHDLEGADLPVCGVAWPEAAAFAKWAKARLPTEAEWERAARGGLEGKEWPWGDEWDPLRVNSDGDQDGYAEAAPVGSFAPNRYGLYDMAGNVEEWCADRWVPQEPRTLIPDFIGPLRSDSTEMTPEERAAWEHERAEEASLPHRAVRGGGWMVPNVGCARRFGRAETKPNTSIGFRLVSPLPEK